MKFIDGYVRSPLAGIAPWILMAVINGPGRFEEAASVALALALLTLWVGSRRGVPVHLLEAFTVVYFAVLAVLGLVASDGVIEWLQLWAGELSNIALAAFAIITLLIRRPFTLAYAKDTTPEEHWDNPIFLRINYVISTAWAGAFLFSALVGAYGDASPAGQRQLLDGMDPADRGDHIRRVVHRVLSRLRHRRGEVDRGGLRLAPAVCHGHRDHRVGLRRAA